MLNFYFLLKSNHIAMNEEISFHFLLMQIPRMLLSSALIIFLSSPILTASTRTLNLATAGKYPYSNPSSGRESYKLAGETVNEARVYDFYQRQADYYMANPDKIPAVIPAFPGLDGGLHGHWGKHNQNGHNDGRWNDGDTGEHFAHVIKGPKDFNVEKGVCVKLGDGHIMSACFDPQTLSYRAVWQGDWVTFGPFRWGSSRGATIDGKPWFLVNNASMPQDSEYLGLRRFGKRVVFEYRIAQTRIQDEPWSSQNSFFRRIDFLDNTEKVILPCQVVDGAFKITFAEQKGIKNLRWSEGEIIAEGVEKNANFIVRISKDPTVKDVSVAITHLQSERKIQKRWKEVLEVPGKRGKPKNGSAYAVDTLTIPYDNPYKTVMQLTSMAFLPNGDALVASLPGDIWLVKGISDSLDGVTWQRYATGFNQPVGIHIDNEGIFVLDRCQISILHDSNDDEEVDYYEKYANDFGGFNRVTPTPSGFIELGMAHFILSSSLIYSAPGQTVRLKPLRTVFVIVWAWVVRKIISGQPPRKEHGHLHPPSLKSIRANIMEVPTKKKIFPLPSAMFPGVLIIQPVAWWKSPVTNGGPSKVHT